MPHRDTAEARLGQLTRVERRRGDLATARRPIGHHSPLGDQAGPIAGAVLLLVQESATLRNRERLFFCSTGPARTDVCKAGRVELQIAVAFSKAAGLRFRLIGESGAKAERSEGPKPGRNR